MRKWWRGNKHWLLRLLVALCVLLVAAASTVVMQALVGAVGFAFSAASMAVLMMIQVVFYFGFMMYYLGGVKTMKVMPGQAGEISFHDYWRGSQSCSQWRASGSSC